MIGTDNAKEENAEDFNETQQAEEASTEKNKKFIPEPSPKKKKYIKFFERKEMKSNGINHLYK